MSSPTLLRHWTVWATLLLAYPLRAEVTVEKTDQGATVQIDGQLFTNYLVKSGSKPILWPLVGPTGKPVTRAFPMAKVAGEETDHVHQRSLWFTHGDVNGVDFWAEGQGHGTIEHREFVKLASGKTGLIVTRNDWLGPNGKRVCSDERSFTLGVEPDGRWIDCDLTLLASDGELVLGDNKEGAFGLRVASSMRVDAPGKGQIVTSRGLTNAAAWGQPAEWVDYHGPVDGETVGIALLNHPSSYGFPSRWHVRPYGLFAANPFCLSAFTGSGDATVRLAAGEKLRLRYRVWLHHGDQQQGRVAEVFQSFAQ